MIETTTAVQSKYLKHPKEWWQQQCRNLYFLEKVILKTAWEDKFHDFGVLQKFICDFLDPTINPSKKKFLSVFRLSFKTTMLLGLCVYLFVWSLATNIPASICYNTAIKENAQIFMDDFRDTLQNCELLHWIFDKWLSRDISKYRKWTQNKVEYGVAKFHVSSLDMQQVMRHYTVYINDDLVNDKNAYSEVERENVKRKWKFQKSIVMKLRKLDLGLEIDVGTPYHSQDHISYMIKENETYDKFIMPYKLILENGEEILTMPEVYTWEDFDDIRKEQGESIFSTQYEIRVLDDSDRICYEKWAEEWTYLPDNYFRILISDPGGWESTANDPTAILIIDVDEFGNIYEVYGEEFWISPYKYIQLLDQLKHIYKPDEMYVEKEKYSVTIADTVKHFAPLLNFSYVEHKNRPKEKRIHRLKQWHETKRIFFKEDSKTKKQALNYPEVSHEGLLECMAYGIEVMEVPSKKVKREREEEMRDDFDEEMVRNLAKINKLQQGENYDAIY